VRIGPAPSNSLRRAPSGRAPAACPFPHIGLQAPPALPAAERWAALVCALVSAPADPRTVMDWSRVVAVSESTLRARCQQAHVSPRKSLALARVLRAVTLAPSVGCRPDDLLDAQDPRTLRGLKQKGGIDPVGVTATEVTLPSILQCQTFVSPGPALNALRTRLALADHGVSGPGR
jgi:hypothetical protein